MFHRFLVFSKGSREFAFGFPDITLVAIFAWNRVDGATSLIIRYWVFQFRKQIPDGLVWFLGNFDVMITQNSFNRLRCALDVFFFLNFICTLTYLFYKITLSHHLN